MFSYPPPPPFRQGPVLSACMLLVDGLFRWLSMDDKVTLHWARLVLGWVTVFRWVYHLGIITKPTRSTQPWIPLEVLNWVPALIGWVKGRNVTSARWQITFVIPYGMWVPIVTRLVALLLYAFTYPFCEKIRDCNKFVQCWNTSEQ